MGGILHKTARKGCEDCVAELCRHHAAYLVDSPEQTPQRYAWLMLWKELAYSKREHRDRVTVAQGGHARLKPGVKWGSWLLWWQYCAAAQEGQRGKTSLICGRNNMLDMRSWLLVFQTPKISEWWISLSILQLYFWFVLFNSFVKVQASVRNLEQVEVQICWESDARRLKGDPEVYGIAHHVLSNNCFGVHGHILIDVVTERQSLLTVRWGMLSGLAHLFVSLLVCLWRMRVFARWTIGKLKSEVLWTTGCVQCSGI